MWHPMCFNKKVALLGTFCVGPTTDEDDKDPNHALPRLTFEVLFTGTFTHMHARTQPKYTDVHTHMHAHMKPLACSGQD